MNTVHLCRFSALAILLAAAPWHVAAQTTSSLVVTPSAVTLTQSEPAAEVTVTTEPAVPSTQFTLLGMPDWLALDLVNTTGYSTGGTYSFRLIPENLDGSSSATVTFTATGLTSTSVTVTVEGTTGGTGIVPSPASLAFTPANVGPEVITLLTNELEMPTYSLSLTYTNGDGWLTVSPFPGTFTKNTEIIVEANPAGLAAGAYTATLRLIRAGTGAGRNIPITLTIGGSSGRTLTPSTEAIILSGATPDVSLTVVPSMSERVPYTLSWSPELKNLLDIGALFATAPAEIAAGGSVLTFSVFEASLVPPTSGTLSLIPHPSTGYEALTLPFAVNTTGELPLGPIRGAPASLAFNAFLGGDRPAARTISVTSTEILNPSHAFNAIVTAGQTWLTVTPNAGITTQTLSVSVNPLAVASPGVYNGNIVLRTITGVVAQNIPVTMTVTQPFAVNVNPNRLTLNGAAGGAVAQGTVEVTLASGTGNPQIQASASTTSGGSWLTVSPNNATLPATLTIGANPANLSIGNYTGNIAVSSGGTTVANIPVTLRVMQAATLQLSASTLTFTHQTTGASGPPAQNVQITSSTGNINWTATAASTGNWLQVNPANGTTPGALAVSVNPSGLQPGSYNGTISVSSAVATNSPRTISVTLTVVTPANPQVTAVVNSASLAPTVAVPGMIFSIFGTDLGPATGAIGTVTNGMLGTTLENVRVLFDGTPAPLLYVSANQINGVVPFEVFGRLNTRMRVEYGGAQSSELELRVEDSAPGIYTEGATGSGQAAALNQNGSANNAQNAEARGNAIVLFATGAGQTVPAGVTGRVETGTGSLQTAPVRVTIGGIEAQVQYAGPAPGLIAGGTQINAVIPQAAPTGPVPVTIQVGNGNSQSNVTISVR